MQADLLLVNARVYTMDKRLPVAQAVAVRAGRILGIGDDSQMHATAGPDTEKLDLQGRTVMPAFTDAHIHLVNYGLSFTQVPLDGIASLEQVLARIAEYASGTKPGEWIRGWGWNRNLWLGAPFPNRGDLDRVTAGNPALLRSKDGHAAWVNSGALELAGLTSATPDPPGGELVRDPATGELTGVLKEDPAIDLVKNTAGPAPVKDMERAIGEASQRLHRLGIIGVHVPEEEHELAALQRVWRSGTLRLRVNMMVPERNLENVLQIGLRAGLGDTFLRLCAIKVYADGSLSTRTADLFDSYDDEPGNCGIEVTTSQRLDRIVAASAAGGWPVAVHALGDRANSRVLDALEQHWREWSKQGLRPRIEHVQLIAPQDLPRLAAMGVIASMQPIHATSDLEMAERHWGKRCSSAYAWRSLLDSGAVLAFGSDAPVEDPSVMKGIFAAVTRQREDGTPSEGWYPEQCLTVPEAVYAYTMGAAYAVGEEGIKGSLAVGKLADMVVLSQDIFNMPPQQILHTRVEATVLNGELVFSNL